MDMRLLLVKFLSFYITLALFLVYPALMLASIRVMVAFVEADEDE